MTIFRRILSLPNAFYFIKTNIVNTSCANLGSKNSFWRVILTQSRCLFIKKSIKDLKVEDETKGKPHLSQLNDVPKNESIDKETKSSLQQTYSSLSDFMEKIQNAPLDDSSMRAHLFGLLNIYKQNRFFPNFSKEMDTFIKSEEFEKFAQNLEQSLPMASTKYLYIVFQVMHSYQIPCSSILMQKLHVLILDNVNKFELTEVMKMYLMVKDKNENLLEPLKNAFSAYMSHLTVDSLKLVGDLKSITYFASKKEIPFSVREEIVKKVLSLGFQLKDLDPIVLTWLSFPLCSEEFWFFDKKHFLNALKQTIGNFEYRHCKTVLENINNGILKKVILYDENLFDLIAQCASKYELWTASIIMTELLKIGHVNYELANSIADKLIEGDIKFLKPVRVEEIVSNFGWIDYKNYLMKKSPEKWFELEEVLKDYMKSGESFKNLKTFVSLFLLELDSKELTGNALNNFANVLESNEEVPRILLHLACLLYQSHCVVYSSPPENVSEKILTACLSEKKCLSSHFWKEAMFETFNGEEYVLEKCKTPLGTLISYAVILGPDHKPINLSSYKKSECQGSDSLDDFIELEKIESPPGSRVFGFIEHTQGFIKFRNVPLLRPQPRLITNIHKNLGYRIFHLYPNQKKTESGACAKILSDIMARELGFIPSRQ